MAAYSKWKLAVIFMGVLTIGQWLFVFREEYYSVVRLYFLTNIGKYGFDTFFVSGHYNATSVAANKNQQITTTAKPVRELCPEPEVKSDNKSVAKFESPSMEETAKQNPEVKSGGSFEPANCRARRQAAIIVPYRDRQKHLHTFLYNMHPFLQRQKLEYTIYLIEQVDNQTFNRGKLLNVGFTEALKDKNWTCFIFHDVDYLPEKDENIYKCEDNPRHVSVAVDRWNYKLPTMKMFGGVTALTLEQFLKMNGYSNDYWGWGGEDNDMSDRIRLSNYTLFRNKNSTDRYKMIKHHRDRGNPVNECRFKLWYSGHRRWKTDGLSNLEYQLLSINKQPLYTKVVADLFEEKGMKRIKDLKVCE